MKSQLLEFFVGGIAVAAALWSAVRFIIRPLWDSLIITSMHRNREVHEARVRSYFYKDLEERQKMRDEVAQHTDQLIALEASMLAQGRALMDKVTVAADGLTRTLTSMEDTLRDIAKDCKDNSTQISGVKGFIDGLKVGRSAKEGAL